MTCYLCNCKTDNCAWCSVKVGKICVDALVCRGCAKKEKSE